MSKTTAEQGNCMVWGSTGSGKTDFCARMVQALLSGQRPDNGHGIHKNNNDSGEHHDNQEYGNDA